MKTVKLLMTSLLAGTAIIATQAQTITGRLTDEKNIPLEYANVVLLTTEDSTFIQGTVTNTNGNFTIDKVNGKTYILKASSVGYKTVYKNCQAGNIGTLKLSSEAVALQETVITARRPTYTMKGNSLVTSVSNSLLSLAGTGNDVLARIPFVQGNDGEFTVFGKGTPLIYINGRLMRDNTELERLNSRDILSVEVITNPGSEYDVTVKSVIKIKTVKPKGEGFSVNARTGLTQNHQTGTDNQLNLNYRRGGLDIFAGIYQSIRQTYQNQGDKHYVAVDTIWRQNVNMHMEGTTHSINTNGGLNYIISNNHSVGARYEYQRIPKSNVHIQTDNEVTADDKFYDQQNYDTHWSNNDYSHKINTYYKGLAGKLDIDLNIDYYSGRNYKKQLADESSQEHEDRLVTTNNISDNELYAGKLVLTHPVGNGQLKAGAEYSHTNRTDRFENPQNYLPETDSEIKEEKLAGFAEYSIALGKLQAAVGVRYEHVTFDYYNEGKYVPEQSRDYNNIFPNISFALPLKELNLSLSYTTKTQRPSYYELRSDLQYNDRFTYEGGNPLLQPETKHDLTFMASYKWIQFMLSYQYRKDAMEFNAVSYEKNPAITVFTTTNYDHIESLNAGLSLSPKFGIWEPSFNIYAAKQLFEAVNMGETVKFNKPVAYFNFNNAFRFTKTLTGNIDMDFHTCGHQSRMYMKESGGVNASINKTFMNDRLNVNIRVNDIFASQRNNLMIYGDHMVFDKWNYSDSRSLRVTLRYSFNSTRSKYRGTGAANEELRRL